MVFIISQHTIYDGRRCVASEEKGDGDIWPATQVLDGRKSQH